jgi:hypothetical protein
MKNIRAFDVVEITDPSGILGQKGGTDHSGRWSVISSHDEFIVLSRGARILRVKPSAVMVVGFFSTDIKIDIRSDPEELTDGQNEEDDTGN